MGRVRGRAALEGMADLGTGPAGGPSRMQPRIADPVSRNGIEQPFGRGQQRRDLVRHLKQVMFTLLEDFPYPQPPVQPLPCLGIDLGAKAGKDLNLFELRVREPEIPRHSAKGRQLRLAANAADRGADVDGRQPALFEQRGAQVDLPVRDGYEVRGD